MLYSLHFLLQTDYVFPYNGMICKMQVPQDPQAASVSVLLEAVGLAVTWSKSTLHQTKQEGYTCLGHSRSFQN